MKIKTPKSLAKWTFLSNHSHVLICIARNPEILLKDVASLVGITERAVQRIVYELEEDGYLTRERVGRQNSYSINRELFLRHPVEADCKIGRLLSVVAKGKSA